jgi:capsular exopolysaccharide synthesis family protein
MIQEVLTERPPVVANTKAIRHGKLSAHYRALVQHIQAANLGAPASQAVETIGITSSARGAGVSTVAFNIAVAAARADTGPILLVDADVAKQSSWRLVKGSPTLGLADALAETADAMDCITNTSIDNLSIVAGRGKAKHDELAFDPFKAAELLNEYKCHFKLVIVDIPAPTELNTSVYLAGKLDGVVLVIESEGSDGRTALRTKQQLVGANANLLGVVLNKRRKHVPNWLINLL